jgi:hypothetical protein
MAVVGEPKSPAMTALARWMGEWTGLGHVVIGMTARGDNAELREYPLGWWANVSWTGRAHTVGLASAWEPTPWRAVERAGWEGLNRTP